MHSLPRCLVVGLTAFALLPFAFSSLRAAPDLPGSKDHPEVKRITGSQIIWYKFAAFDELNIPLEPVYLGSSDEGGWRNTRRQHVEGKHTAFYYVMPTGVSTLEVVNQYASDLQQRGFAILWKGGGEDALENHGGYFAKRAYPTDLTKEKALDYLHFYNNGDQRFVALKGPGPNGGEMYVTVLGFAVADDQGASNGYGALQKLGNMKAEQAMARVDILETKPMEARMSVVKAEEITDSVAKTGHVAIYGVYFDTDKADLKPESKDALAEMAQAIKAAGAGKRFLIVGHTDNQGAFDHNQTLSAKRAHAVTDALAKEYGLPAGSIVPVGVGMAAPVAPNNDDAGRAKNRRVEIVAM